MTARRSWADRQLLGPCDGLNCHTDIESWHNWLQDGHEQTTAGSLRRSQQSYRHRVTQLTARRSWADLLGLSDGLNSPTHGGMIAGGIIRKRVLVITSPRGTSRKKLKKLDWFGHANWVNSSNCKAATLRFGEKLDQAFIFRTRLYLVTLLVRVTVSLLRRSQVWTISFRFTNWIQTNWNKIFELYLWYIFHKDI